MKDRTNGKNIFIRYCIFNIINYGIAVRVSYLIVYLIKGRKIDLLKPSFLEFMCGFLIVILPVTIVEVYYNKRYCKLGIFSYEDGEDKNKIISKIEEKISTKTTKTKKIEEDNRIIFKEREWKFKFFKIIIQWLENDIEVIIEDNKIAIYAAKEYKKLIEKI